MSVKEFGFVLLFLAAWIVLNRWVLPWFGVPTCMSGGCGGGSCSLDQRPAGAERAPESQDARNEPSAEPGVLSGESTAGPRDVPQ